MNSDNSSARILVVDDNPGTLYATARTLTSAGFTVAQVSNGYDGVQYAATNPVDLVVLDVNLPDMDGFEVCRRIREIPARFHLPVIYLSASFVTDMDKVVGFEAGADGYLTHPVDPTVMTATVRAFLRTRTFEVEREKLLASERQAREDAERANRAKDEFLATLSHELRSPLNAIVGWAEVLRAQPDATPASLEAINIIVRNARFQAQLISDLLDVSRINAGKLRLSLQEANPRALMDEAVELIQQAAHAKSITVHCSVDSELGSLQADPPRFQQIVVNLVGNAIKFSPEGSRVMVSLRAIDGEAELVVQDEGRGIAAPDLERIFDRFWQEDTSSRRVHAGLGLGLAIVKSLTELHGGSVRAESDGEGLGARFIVRVPRTEGPGWAASPGVDSSSRAPSRTPSLSGVRILLVDDDPDARLWVHRLVGGLGAEVAEAGDVAQALTTLERFSPHVMISDLGMPQQDGFDLVKLLRARGLDATQLPAIALSAFASSEDRANALAAGYQVFLTKPPEPSDVIDAVARLTIQHRIET